MNIKMKNAAEQIKEKIELSAHDDFQLYCHCCGDRAPEEYENAAG